MNIDFAKLKKDLDQDVNFNLNYADVYLYRTEVMDDKGNYNIIIAANKNRYDKDNIFEIRGSSSDAVETAIYDFFDYGGSSEVLEKYKIN